MMTYIRILELPINRNFLDMDFLQKNMLHRFTTKVNQKLNPQKLTKCMFLKEMLHGPESHIFSNHKTGFRANHEPKLCLMTPKGSLVPIFQNLRIFFDIFTVFFIF